MELQLGLALPTTNDKFPVKAGCLDLNINNFLCQTTAISDGSNKNKKRSFARAFDEPSSNAVPRKQLPWLLWNNQPNDDDDDEDDTERSSRYTVMIKNEEDGLVGWPPIKTWRKENCFHIHGDGGGVRPRTVRINGGGSTFVKVKMEGVGIARKIDLSLHQSFHTLLRTLMNMFGKCEMDSNNYNLTYQDREGDWLLAHDQDVPWRAFVRSVQRLKLLKRGD